MKRFCNDIPEGICAAGRGTKPRPRRLGGILLRTGEELEEPKTRGVGKKEDATVGKTQKP